MSTWRRETRPPAPRSLWPRGGGSLWRRETNGGPRSTKARSLAEGRGVVSARSGRALARAGVALLSALALACSGGGTERAGPPGASADGRPHVVVYCIDTLRADHLGLYGYERDTSPFLDRLAGEAVVFDRAVSQAPWTLPSVASFLTSTYPSTHRVLRLGRRLPHDRPTMAEVFRAAGYQTVGFVRNAFAGSASGAERGFDVFFDRLRRGRDGEHGTRHELRELVEWLGSRRSRAPLFLYVHTVEPHWPYFHPRQSGPFAHVSDDEKAELDSLLRRFRRLRRRRRGESADAERRRVAELRAVQRQLEARRQLAIDQYDEAVRRADRGVRRVVDALRRHGYWDRTIFALISDHGQELDDHGYWQHDQSLHAELIDVPMILRLPDGPSGLRIEEPVQLIDLLPTLADLVGAPRRPTWEGRSLVRLLRSTDGGRKAAHRRVAVSERINLGRHDPWLRRERGDVEIAAVGRDRKAILLPERRQVRLYDLRRDPHEHRDVASRHPRAMARLARAAASRLAPRGKARRVREHALPPRAVDSLRALGYVR